MAKVEVMEFLCLSCGLQGMVQQNNGFSCPKCGEDVISSTTDSETSEVLN
ncbi:hypothetical protein PRVXH_001542 [Proteinivorax hydrogeniformans]|uniref:Zinc ribbon protein n=1 Tax=Proteinivorax hydrogeniformans TaxID=1826727 RepID=A0AAU8HR77_9FIRM